MYALRVCMPYGYVCPVGMYALRVCMSCGYKWSPAAQKRGFARGSNLGKVFAANLLLRKIFAARSAVFRISTPKEDMI